MSAVKFDLDKICGLFVLLLSRQTIVLYRGYQSRLNYLHKFIILFGVSLLIQITDSNHVILKAHGHQELHDGRAIQWKLVRKRGIVQDGLVQSKLA